MPLAGLLAARHFIQQMIKPEKPMTDDELKEMVYLFRVVRAGNDRPGEKERCAELLRRYEEQKKK